MESREFVANETHRSRCFAATCAIGRAVQSNWRTLIGTEEQSHHGVPDVMEFLDVRLISQFGDLDYDDFKKLLGYARGVLKSLQENLPEDSGAARLLFEALVGSIQDWSSDSEIEEHLGTKLSAARRRVTEIVNRWGGAKARSRLDGLKDSLKEVALVISDEQDSKVMFTYMPSDQPGIWLTYGPPEGSLLSYLNLEFYFFHEYLSHIFPSWDDVAREFSEGYLFQLAHWDWTFTAEAIPRINVLKSDFAHHAKKLGTEGRENDWTRAQTLGDLYREKHCWEQFPRVLLELAAFEDRKRPHFGREFIRRLYWVHADNLIREELLKSIRKNPEDLEAMMRVMNPYIERHTGGNSSLHK